MKKNKLHLPGRDLPVWVPWRLLYFSSAKLYTKKKKRYHLILQTDAVFATRKLATSYELKCKEIAFQAP